MASPRTIGYKPLSGGINEHGDLDGAADCVEDSKKCLASIADRIAGCYNCCCMNCDACFQALTACCAEFGKALMVNGYNGLIRPIGSGLGEFFTAKNGKVRWYQPGMDLAAGTIGNPVTILAVDPFFTVDRQDKAHFWPLANPVGRIVEFYKFLSNAAHGIEPRKNLVAAATVMTLSAYFALTTAGVADSILAEGLSWDLVNPLKVLNPAMGVRALQNLIQGDPTLWQKIIVPTIAYMGLTHGFAAGKKVANADFTAWKNAYLADVRRDSFERHLDHLANLDEDAAKKAHATYQAAVLQGKNWKVVDGFGRALERILQLPAQIIQAPSHNLWNITGAKAVLVAQGALRRKKDKLKEKLKERASACATAVLDCVGRKVDVDDEPSSAVEVKVEAKEVKEVPSFDEIMEQVKKGYGRSTAASNRLIGAVKRDHVGDGRQTKLNRELESRYIQDVVNHSMYPDFAPTPFLPTAPPPAYSEEWGETAKANPDIQKMLVGEFPNPSATPLEKAKLYHESVYAAYKGKPEEIATLVAASRPPAYAPTDGEAQLAAQGDRPPATQTMSSPRK